MKRSFEIFCVGELMLESFFQISEFPRLNRTLVLDRDRNPEVGGPAFNLAWYLSKLGDQPRLIGIYGEADKEAVKIAVDQTALRYGDLVSLPGGSDRLISVLTEKGHQSVYFRAEMSNRAVKKIRNSCANAKVLVLTGSRHKAVRDLYVNFARERQDRFIVFNPSYAITEYNRRQLMALLSRADLVVFNEDEARYASKLLRTSRTDMLSKRSRGILVITRGGAGQTIFRNGKREETNSLLARVRNPIGAGDAFLAGFLHMLLRKKSTFDAAKFGSTVAAYAVESKNVRAKISRRAVASRSLENTVTG